MARANPVARKLLAAVVAPLVKEHGGPPKVAGIVGRHRATVTRWVKGDIDWDGLTDLASGLRRDIVVTFPAHGHASVTTKEPPPEWARALQDRVEELALVIEDAHPKVKGQLEEEMHGRIDGIRGSLPQPTGESRPEGQSPRDTPADIGQ